MTTRVFSGGSLQEFWDRGPLGIGVTDLPWEGCDDFDGILSSYANIYRSQPNVRTVIDFIARSVAQLRLHVYQRTGFDARERLNDHPLAQSLENPGDRRTQYDLLDDIMHDLLIYDRAYVMKFRERGRVLLRRLRPNLVWVALRNYMNPAMWEGIGDPAVERQLVYWYCGVEKIPREKLIVFRGYDPTGFTGTSPMETLRTLLYLDTHGQQSQLQRYRNGARIDGWLERPLDAPQWSKEARDRFKSDFRSKWTGSGPDAGGAPVLEDGMKFHGESFNPEQLQYLQERKLTMQQVASAYHVQPTMIGIIQGTYANTQEHHKMLYQDTLGPTLEKLEQRFNMDLVSDFGDDLFVDFNVAEKLEGDFREQSRSYQVAVGRPWMSANEARARLNLPLIDDPSADGLVVPLNVLVSGQPSPPPGLVGGGVGDARELAESQQAAQRQVAARALVGSKWDFEADQKQAPREVNANADLAATRLADDMARFYDRTEKQLLAKLKAIQPLADAWGAPDERDAELAAILLRHDYEIARWGARSILRSAPGYDWDDGPMLVPLTAHTMRAARAINGGLYDRLLKALREADWRPALLGVLAAMRQRAKDISISERTTAYSLGRNEAARATGKRSKIWRVASNDPRASHAALDGERVPMGSVFSNGARYPGDPRLGPEDRANCQCQIEFSDEEVA